MENRQFLKKIYRKFSDFISISSARELEFIIIDSKFKASFNKNMKSLFKEIKNDGIDDIEFTIFFNTDDEIVLIDASILGKFISDAYTLAMEKFYKGVSLNKIAKEIVNGNDKSKEDFIAVSYKVLYSILIEMYREIKCRRDLLERLKKHFKLSYYNKEDISIVIISLQIIEDICKYLKIDESSLINFIQNSQKNNITK